MRFTPGPASPPLAGREWGCRGASMQKWPASVGGTAGLVVVLSASTDRYGCGSGACTVSLGPQTLV
jgi:hypothetical protein